MPNLRVLCGFCGPLLFLFAAAGCGSPNKANIELRKQNQELRDKIKWLQEQRAADAVRISAATQRLGSIPTLPDERLAQLSTAHGLQFGHLTGGTDIDLDKPGDEGVKVAVVPIDADGSPIKALGSFKIEVFDLAGPAVEKVAQCDIAPEQARSAFFSNRLLYTYVFTCPWTQAPKHSDLTLRVRFIDGLTQRALTVERTIKINVPPRN